MRVVALSTTSRGRVRCRVQGLRDNPAFRSELLAELDRAPDIVCTRASTITGSLLLQVSGPLAISEVLDRITMAARRSRVTALGEDPPAGADATVRRDWQRPGVEAPSPGSIAPQRDWHCLSSGEVIDLMGSHRSDGLSGADAENRYRAVGANHLGGLDRRSDWSILVNQFQSWPVALLGVSAGVAVLSGGLLDAAAIGSVILVNAGIGFATERFAERTIASLTHDHPDPVTVRRGGTHSLVEPARLVPGDIVLLQPGSLVPADLRLVGSERLTLDESLLTGESVSVAKDHAWIGETATPLAERTNMLYSGTAVTGGSGTGIVVATAAATEIGRIHSLVGQTASPATPMQRQLDRLSTQLAVASAGLCALVYVVGTARGYGAWGMLKSAISLGVAAVPEGLPAVATSSLALGVRDMRQRKVLIRRLEAVETLGSVEVMCLDKTGTLTTNRMSVVRLHDAGRSISVRSDSFLDHETDDAVDIIGDPSLIKLLQICVLCNEARVGNRQEGQNIHGSATEAALLRVAQQADIDVAAVRARYPLVHTQYRSEGRPYMITVHADGDGGRLVALKGRPKDVLAKCSHFLAGEKLHPMDDRFRDMAIAANSRMADDALRVLGVAYQRTDELIDHAPRTPYTWLGLVGMADPVRDGIRQLIGSFHDAGIATTMITGDQATTAYAIGQQLDLSRGEPLRVVKATALNELGGEEAAQTIEQAHVFARVTPADKLRIVRALQKAGRVVAMTGDGINDSPALRAADVGIAMGDGGSNVARSVSDVVLKDDDLPTLVGAMKQGRALYANIRKSLHFLLSTNMSEVQFMLAALALGLGRPLNPMQLLWINLVTDIFPGLALSFERAESDVMQRPPRDPHEPVIGRTQLRRMGVESLAITGGTLASYWYALRRYGAGPRTDTFAFTTLTLAQLVHAYHCRSDRWTIFEPGRLPARNRQLDLAIGASIAAQGLTLLVPGLRRLLRTTPLGSADMAVAVAMAILPFLANEASKSASRRRKESAA